MLKRRRAAHERAAFEAMRASLSSNAPLHQPPSPRVANEATTSAQRSLLVSSIESGVAVREPSLWTTHAANACRAESLDALESDALLARMRALLQQVHGVVEPRDAAAVGAVRNWCRRRDAPLPSVVELGALLGGDDEAKHVAKWLLIYMRRAPASECAPRVVGSRSARVAANELWTSHYAPTCGSEIAAPPDQFVPLASWLRAHKEPQSRGESSTPPLVLDDLCVARARVCRSISG